jgi:GTP cyclohydrolase I
VVSKAPQDWSAWDLSFQQLLNEMGDDPQRPDLQTTPKRMREGLLQITEGYKTDADNLLRNSLFAASSQDLVVVTHIPFYSLCEHHVLPFFGTCSVGYIPNMHITGLSRIPAFVRAHAMRLQVQERLTHTLAQGIEAQLAPRGVGVVMSARHMCMEMRDMRSCQSPVNTSCWLGDLQKSELKQEFLELTR